MQCIPYSVAPSPLMQVMVKRACFVDTVARVLGESEVPVREAQRLPL